MSSEPKDEERLRGYLLILKQSLRSFFSEERTATTVRDVDEYVRLKLSNGESLERVLAVIGTPVELARAYASEATVEKAVVTARPGAVFQALWVLALSRAGGFWKAYLVFVGYLGGFLLLGLGFLKPIFPDNVGILMRDGFPVGLGAVVTPGTTEVVGGYWIIPLCLILGFLVLSVSHRAAGRAISRFREDLKKKLEQLES